MKTSELRNPIALQNNVEKTKPKCWSCKKILDNRVPRPFLLKLFLPFLKLKKYKCTNCLLVNYKMF